jgi:hypothetical protein
LRKAGFLFLLLCLWLSGFSLLSLASARELPLLVPVVRTGFQFVGFALETVEVKDFLGVRCHTNQLCFCSTTIMKWPSGSSGSPNITIAPPLSRHRIKASLSAAFAVSGLSKLTAGALRGIKIRYWR